MFQRTRKPAFAIAFVGNRFCFSVYSGYSNFKIVKQSSLKLFQEFYSGLTKLLNKTDNAILLGISERSYSL